jgi:1-acyl-sn-glycerol-3-phosphate acyltransferase|nr:lysophospholipid acyltransferase family protein [Kofleriaceae bacterium]
MPAMAEDLGRVEKLARWLGRVGNETEGGQRFQNAVLRRVSYVWVRQVLANRILAEGLDDVVALEPPAGVLFVSNHRSFFDLFSLLLACYMGPVPWARHLHFPVRSNFFYDHPLGMAVNFLAAGGAMYPPIYREAERRVENDAALDKMIQFLQQKNTIVGIHPEGTRNKTDDPYKFLPAQPGVGKLALLARPTVLPLFINGVGNDFVKDVKINFTSKARRNHAVVAVFGPPVDYSDLLAEKPRPTLYKKCADRFMVAIRAQSEREKVIRAELDAGRVDLEGDPRWIVNRGIVSPLYAKPG